MSDGVRFIVAVLVSSVLGWVLVFGMISGSGWAFAGFGYGIANAAMVAFLVNWLDADTPGKNQ